MKAIPSIFVLLLAGSMASAQAGRLAAGTSAAQSDQQTSPIPSANPVALDPQRERHGLQVLLKLAEKWILSAADAMPADKYQFVPTDGEFKGVRTFAEQVKHLSATNHILAVAALGEEPPAGAGDEIGPDNVRTKAEILEYARTSFAHLQKAVDEVGGLNATVKASPISPLKSGEVTRISLIVEALVHALDHYGQMVEYLRMNGVVPPASRPTP